MGQPAVAIPEKIFFKIGEVCDLVEVQAHVLRYWETEFPMLSPQKNRSGQRSYRRRDVEIALRIKELLYEDLYTIAGATGFLLSSFAGAYLPDVPLLRGAGMTVGASASVFGLLGALVAYGKLRGSSAETSQALGYAIALFLFGLVMSGVDNWAHAGGFVGGYLTARVLDPWKPERINHLVGALVCLAISALAIIASLIHYSWMAA
jgi:hypothetical protein